MFLSELFNRRRRYRLMTEGIFCPWRYSGVSRTVSLREGVRVREEGRCVYLAC